MKRGTNCGVHAHRHPVPIETHHIWPQEFGGPTIEWNLEDVCSNGHGDTHYYLNLTLKHGYGHVPATIARSFGWRVQHLARHGYDLISEHKPALLKSVRAIAISRLEPTPLTTIQLAWRDFSIAYRGCPFGSHEPGEPHHYSCNLMED